MEARARQLLRTAWPERRSDRIAVISLGAIVLAGVVVRLWLTYAWRPALGGYHDEPEYLAAASGNLFADTMRPMGYAIFLRVVHFAWPHLTLVVLTQHVLGIASALLLFGAVRRITGSRWPGLVPAAVVCLVGAEIFVEHAILTESVFILLQAAAIYALVRRLDSDAIGWPMAAGLLAGASATIRVAGLYLVPVAIVAAALVPDVRRRQRWIGAGAAAVGAAVVLVAYMTAAHDGNGHLGLTRAGGWNNYGRVARFADCSKFKPPSGTAALCDPTPKSRRLGPMVYVFEPISPAVKAFGHPYGPGAQHTSQVSAFVRAAIVNQPGDYLSDVWRDLERYYDDDVFRPRGDGLSYAYFGTVDLWAQDPLPLSPYWKTGSAYSVKSDSATALKRYHDHTLIRGPLWLALIVLTLLAPVAAPKGRLRFGATLLTVTTLCATVLPVASLMWDARFAIPSLGILGASAAVGGFTIWPRLRRVAARVRSTRKRSVAVT